ncbi:thiosulfate sulfurtransferase/rhodanese-like domain-containing protein 3 [Chiloscyllium plagiosum]|uniref:thiosulfate sulfurtransferase/rhodanese-like domain-containing protein 3 n=1 Tax=Chiloscyllium plagiosum TaxID=36176 RepID=UPI001CB7F1CA|nr:thiosulfate sulfurtransferase/rhodanese-like domain-containing protein 3 [Chiloscyllium plagiosum]
MTRVLAFVSALLLRTACRSSVAQVCRQLRNQRPLSWAPFYLTQHSSYWSVCTAPCESVTYQELKQLLKSKTIVIDVREPWEIKEYGQIPGSINVPLGEVEQALKLDSSKFMETYNGKMPSTSDKIVFSCLAGVRSKKALETAMSLGYSRALHFPGGWEEWVKCEFAEHQR